MPGRPKKQRFAPWPSRRARRPTARRGALCWSLCLGWLLAALAVARAEPPATGRQGTNVVLIVADDLGWADLACYGSTFHRSPRLDGLARQGVRFTSAYAACPVCSPTRAALLTGCHPARLHLTDWLPGRADHAAQRLLRPAIRGELPLEAVTLAETFRQSGYATGNIGKWHLGGPGFGPREQGFDVNIAGDEAGTPLSYVAPFSRGRRAMAGLEEAPAGQYLTDRLAEEAERFIDAFRDQPFFLYLPHFAVHTPLVAHPEVVEEYAARSSARPGAQRNAVYAAMIESLDSAVGRVLDRLQRHGLAERTIVLFTSDNGGLATAEGPKTPSTSNAPLREGKGYLYEGGIRVPLIISGPGMARGATCDVPVSSVDVVPTLAALCGLSCPQPIDGMDVGVLCRDPTSGLVPRDRPLFWHYPHYSNQGGRPGGAVRRGNYKLIESYEDQRRELYDLAADPGESTNLVDRQPELVGELAGRLEQWRAAVGAQSNQPNPNYQPHPQAQDGSVTLPARTADVHGVMLRYEPLPHKNTLGYWVRADDWASWQFTLARPGRFDVIILQGCGTGSGGSHVEFRFGADVLATTVEETGGFQVFVERRIGQVSFDRPGRYTLEVKPRSKPGPAVMDLREVVLRPR